MHKKRWLKILCNLDLLLAAVTLIALLIITCSAVFMRYVLKAPLLWQEEAQAFCQVWMIFLGGSVAFRTGGIVAIEIIVDSLQPKVKQAFEYFIDLFIVIIRLSAKGTDEVMKHGAFAVDKCLLYFPREELYTTQPEEVSGGAV